MTSQAQIVPSPRSMNTYYWLRVMRSAYTCARFHCLISKMAANARGIGCPETFDKIMCARLRCREIIRNLYAHIYFAIYVMFLQGHHRAESYKPNVIIKMSQSYLARVLSTIGVAGADHVVSDVSTVPQWLVALGGRDDWYLDLLQSGVIDDG